MIAMRIEVYFDGLCEPVNPGGIATYGFIIYIDGKKVYDGCGVICGFNRNATNNVAEYTALIEALKWLLKNGFNNGKVRVKGDSQLVIRQLNGYYSVRSPRILPLYGEAVKLAEKFRHIEFRWIPRRLNEEADSLSRKAYRKYCRENKEKFLKHYSKYLISDRQRRYIYYLAKKTGINVGIDEFTSKREASKIISNLLRKICY